MGQGLPNAPPASQPVSLKLIALDPGHGGIDRGTVQNGIEEASLVLCYATEIGTELEKRGFAVVYTRGHVEPLERVRLERRGEITKGAHADLVVSLHVNAAALPDGKTPNPAPSGAIVFYSAVSEVARRVAERIFKGLPAMLTSGRNAHVFAAHAESWPRVYNVLKVHPPASLLIELGFASNPGEAEYLARLSTIREVVQAVADAIEEVAKGKA